MRTLYDLSQSAGRIFLRVGGPGASRLLAAALRAEGFTLGGRAPAAEDLGAVMCLNPDRSVSYPGIAGNLAFGCAGTVGGRPLIRVDAEKYLTGEAEYLV